MNKTERVTISGQTFIPEDEFVAMLGEFQVSLNEYTETTGMFSNHPVWTVLRQRVNSDLFA